jgi:hypothetical protein
MKTNKGLLFPSLLAVPAVLLGGLLVLPFMALFSDGDSWPFPVASNVR